MKLHHQISGSGEPLIILHGLFGTLENWGAQTLELSQYFQVISVDLRNHGRSPHSDVMSYEAMADDIQQLMQELTIERAHIMGHSMGGKVAMQLALSQPQLINKLIIADIAPVSYEPHHDEIFAGLNAIKLAELTSRKDADNALASHVQTPAVRAFLLKNLYRDEQQHFRWRPNLDALQREYHNISKPPHGTPFPSAALFIKGMNSNYILREHSNAINALFPAARFKIIEGAGHWLHAEKPKIFSKIVLNFLNRG
ncbi:MAG: alpha/beta fold hydrolase [Pseudomonadales bacterium]